MKSLILTLVVAVCASTGTAGDSFPAFDAETITGDGLVALCAKMNRPLVAEEVDSLRERLAGRRLTFTFSSWQAGCWGSDADGNWFMGVKFPDEGRFCGNRPGVLLCRFYLRDERDRDINRSRDKRNLRVTGTVNAEREKAPKNGPMDYHPLLLAFDDATVDRSDATTECCIPEFYGLHFGQPTQMSTNGLSRFVGEGSRSRSGGPNVKYRYQTWQRIDDGLRPANFFDRAIVTYTYKTLTPVSATFVGHFPKGASRAECLASFDAFVAELNAKYSARLAEHDGWRNDVDPEGFVPRDPPKKLKDWIWRYMHDRKFGEKFAEYAGGLNGCLLRATLCESHYGERVVRLSVEGYRKESPYGNVKLDVDVIEGLLSYEEK